MACELWVRGVQAETLYSLSGTYVDIFFKVVSPSATLPLFQRLNPTKDRPFDAWYPPAIGSSWALPGTWSTSSPPEVYFKQGCDNYVPPAPLSPQNPHDCINGNCLPKSVYGTPGIFASLSACESGCAKNSNCTGECIPSGEINNLRAAVVSLQKQVCK